MGPKVKEEKAKPLHSPLLSRLLPPPHFFFLLLPWLLISLQNPILSQCHHTPVIFSFGDSNSDTGGLVGGLSFPVNFPNGCTFFRRSTGRLSDGRLIIDILCKSLHPTTTLGSHFFFQCGGWEGGFRRRVGSCLRGTATVEKKELNRTVRGTVRFIRLPGRTTDLTGLKTFQPK